MPRRPRPWRGSLRAHRGWILLTIKDSSGKWVEKTTGEADTPAGWRAAERLRAEVVAKLQSREAATGSTAPVTVDAWAKTWLAERDNRDRENDEARLRLHVLPALGSMLLEEVQPRHLAALAKEWQAKAPRTRRNIYSVTKALFRDARIAGVLNGPDPCILTHRQLGRIKDGPGFVRREAVFTRDELEALISDERIPPDRRVWNALLGVGILRTGEAAGLRWGKVLPGSPLGCLIIDRSYDGPTKAGEERWMPVHPALAAVLAEWRLGGWARAFGRPPTPDDLVLPVTPEPPRKGRMKPAGAMRDKEYAYKRLRSDLVTLSLRHRRGHDLRRTGISLARSDGANADLLERGTHHAPAAVMDLYTTPEWEALCREVSKLRVRIIRAGPGSSGHGADVRPS
jgi:integrase